MDWAKDSVVLQTNYADCGTLYCKVSNALYAFHRKSLFAVWQGTLKRVVKLRSYPSYGMSNFQRHPVR